MNNKYLTKIAALLRPVENLVARTKQLSTGIANREMKIGKGITSKPDPITATKKLTTLQDQSSKRMWAN